MHDAGHIQLSYLIIVFTAFQNRVLSHVSEKTVNACYVFISFMQTLLNLVNSLLAILVFTYLSSSVLYSVR